MSQHEISRFIVDRLEVVVYPERRTMGDAAASTVAELMKRIAT